MTTEMFLLEDGIDKESHMTFERNTAGSQKYERFWFDDVNLHLIFI